MHILGILVFSMALIIACEVIRQTLITNGSRILDAMAGVAPDALPVHTEGGARVIPFKAAARRPALAPQPERLAA